MSENKKRKVTWSIKVHAGLKEWFEERASVRHTDPQEDVRQILADFREDILNQVSKEDQ